VAQRCEDELDEEQWAFVDGCQRDWEGLPIPDGPITVGIDGGYVRNWDEKKQHCEVIVGKSIVAFRREDEEELSSSKCFGFVQTLDTKPKRCLFEVLKSQGHQMNQQLTLADAMDQTGGASAVTNAGENPESGTRDYIPTLVPGSAARRGATGSLIPSFLMLSAASMPTLDKLDPSWTGRICISTMICYASMSICAGLVINVMVDVIIT
jgi:hypothetical protein